MENSCEFCDSCYKCPLNWDCVRTSDNQNDYDNNEDNYELPLWDNGEFYKD